MVSRIYTQADYDKITDLYNEYQGKKDTYTPEQQQSIESAFGNARAQVSNRIEESKNKLVDMYNDEQGNTWGEYGDGRKEILNAAPTPTPNPNVVPQKATRRTPEIPTNTPAMSDDNYYNNWMNQLREEQYTIGGKPMTETPHNPDQLQSNNLLQGTNNNSFDPSKKGSYKFNDDGSVTMVGNGGAYITTSNIKDWHDAMKQFGTYGYSDDVYNSNNLGSFKYDNNGNAVMAGKGGASITTQNPKDFQNTRNQLTGNKSTINDYLSQYSEGFQNDVRRILSNGGYITNDGFLKRADGSVVTKL